MFIATENGPAEVSGLSAEEAVHAVEVAARALRVVPVDAPAVRLLAESAQAAGIRLEPSLTDDGAADDYEPVTRDELYELHLLLVRALVDQPASGSALRAEALAWLNFLLQVTAVVIAIVKS